MEGCDSEILICAPGCDSILGQKCNMFVEAATAVGVNESSRIRGQINVVHGRML